MQLKSLWKLLNPPDSLPPQEKEKERKKETPVVLEKFGTDILRVYIFLTKTSTSPKKAWAFLKISVLVNGKTVAFLMKQAAGENPASACQQQAGSWAEQ